MGPNEVMPQCRAMGLEWKSRGFWSIALLWYDHSVSLVENAIVSCDDVTERPISSSMVLEDVCVPAILTSQSTTVVAMSDQ